MRVLMPVSFKSERGGLHDHVEQIAIAARARGVEVVVLCRPGPFARRLATSGITVISVDPADTPRAVKMASGAGPWDLVHTHPFAARRMGIEFARQRSLPLVATFHGWYLDEIETWHRYADAIIGVTGAIAERIRSTPGIAPERVHVVENGLDPAKVANRHAPVPGDDRILSVVSRLDTDFRETQRVLTDFMYRAAQTNRDRWRVVVAGDGSERERIVYELGRIALSARALDISFLGWCAAAELRDLYSRSFATISPGRSAIDAIAAGIPTVMTRQVGTYALDPIGSTARLHYGSPGERVAGDAFYDYCVELASSEDLLAQHAEHARSWALHAYDPVALEGRLYAIYMSVTGSYTPRARVRSGSHDSPFSAGHENGVTYITYQGPHDSLEFAFYVLRDGDRLRAEWYAKSPTIKLTPEEQSIATAVRCFVKRPDGTIDQHIVRL